LHGSLVPLVCSPATLIYSPPARIHVFIASRRYPNRTAILSLHLRQILEIIATNRNLLAYGAEFDQGLPVVEVADTAPVALVLARSDEYFLASQGIVGSLVHSGHCRATRLLLVVHVLGAKDLNVSRLLNEQTIGLLESLVPEEDHVFVQILDYTLATLIYTIDDLDDIVVIDGVSLSID
jgi:hypothetical protein